MATKNGKTVRFCDFYQRSGDLSNDARAMFTYLLLNTKNGLTFCFAKPSTVMEDLGWRSLDKVDAVAQELVTAGWLGRGLGQNHFTGQQVQGWNFLTPKAAAQPELNDAPKIEATTEAASEPVMFAAPDNSAAPTNSIFPADPACLAVYLEIDAIIAKTPISTVSDRLMSTRRKELKALGPAWDLAALKDMRERIKYKPPPAQPVAVVPRDNVDPKSLSDAEFLRVFGKPY